jgi:phage regulator Rha-like protein
MVPQLTGKDHNHVLRDIRKILDEVEIDESKFGLVYLAGNGEERICYNLPRLECDLVVSGYSAKYRLAIIDRWLVVPQITGKPHDNVLIDIRRIL